MKRNNVFVMVLVLIIVMVSGIAFGQEEESYDLRLKLKSGDEHRLNSYVYQRMEEEIMGHKIALEMFTTAGFKYIVGESSAENVYNLTIKYTDLESSLEEFSSDLGIKPEEINPNLLTDSTNNTLQYLLDKDFSLQLSDKGEVLDIEGFDNVMEELLSKIENPSSEVKINIEKIKNMFGKDFIKQSWGQFFDYIPEQEVHIGESWKSVFNMNQGFPISLIATYTLIDVTADEFIIEMKAEIKSNGGMGLFDTPDVKINIELDGYQTGELHIDRSTNWLLKMKSKLIIDGKMSMTVPGPQPKIEVPMSIKAISLTN